ncbi:unnamed protein product [Polarella glacialis]|uniref:Lariat debranching enzyme C-terminal domain-containing protein n=1 Tax=Polarella glacialis TaxID=89957 RepID=A0A813FHK2_POLGL|nr:unnamed protein product [Polarella glacialis]
MRVAVQGCCNGELDKVYDAVRKLQERQGIAVDLLICCGDFQSVRDEKDLDCVAAPDKYKEMKDFHRYYSGEKKAPVLTIFVGGKHEASNLLREHYFGGWVAPNIYYLGAAGVVRVGPLRIAAISGTFSPADYFRGHHECPPYTEETRRSAYHVREWDVARLQGLQEPVDIVVSYDWPRGIWKFGNYEEMFLHQDLSSDLKREMDGNTLGSPAAMDLLKKLRPPFWFSANLHVKFPALVPHGDGTFTRFLALDRCKGRREFLQVLDIDPSSPSCMRSLPQVRQGTRWPRPTPGPPLCFDLEWLALQKVNHQNMDFAWKPEKAKIAPPSKDDIAWVKQRLEEKVGGVPRPAPPKRHPSLLPTKLREAGGEGGSFKNFSMLQLRELYETRGLEFPGHLDKASMVKQLEEFDEFFADEGGAEISANPEAYPIPENFAADHSNPAAQRALVCDLLELEDVWQQQEAVRREQTRLDPQFDQTEYDPFSEAPEGEGNKTTDEGAAAQDKDESVEVQAVQGDSAEPAAMAEPVDAVEDETSLGDVDLSASAEALAAAVMDLEETGEEMTGGTEEDEVADAEYAEAGEMDEVDVVAEGFLGAVPEESGDFAQEELDGVAEDADAPDGVAAEEVGASEEVFEDQEPPGEQEAEADSGEWDSVAPEEEAETCLRSAATEAHELAALAVENEDLALFEAGEDEGEAETGQTELAVAVSDEELAEGEAEQQFGAPEEIMSEMDALAKALAEADAEEEEEQQALEDDYGVEDVAQEPAAAKRVRRRY